MAFTSVEMVYFTCGSCGTLMGMSRVLHDIRWEDRKDFWCPLGCKVRFVGESKEQKLIRERDAAVRAEALAKIARDAALKQARRFRCPHCPKSYASAQKLKGHERLAHMAPLRLPKDAGPDALNSKVN